MPVTARRTALHRAETVQPARSTSPSRISAKHRRTKTATAPRAAAAMTLSVGLAVSAAAVGGATEAAAQTPHQRGSMPIKTKPLLRYGDSGSAVRYVQAHLRMPLTNNWYGSATRTKVANFQRAIGLPPTGSVNPKTWNAVFYIAKYGRTQSGGKTTFHTKVLREAAKLKGTPYRYGGTTPKGFDCSGYTDYVYTKSGKSLPRTSRQQYSATKHISRASAKPGDLVFFKSSSGSVYHVGIYAGSNMLWHSSKPGVPVKKAKIWSSRVAFGRR